MSHNSLTAPFKMQQNLAQCNGTMRIKSWDIKIDLCE
jgi:acetyl-CoA hydrolase